MRLSLNFCKPSMRYRIRVLQGLKRAYGQPGCSKHIFRALEQEISEDLPVLAGQPGQSERLFQAPPEVRRLIYTTSAIEGFNRRQPRKVTKAKSVFPTDDSLLKMLYLSMVDIKKMDWQAARLEPDPRPTVHLLCRTYA